MNKVVGVALAGVALYGLVRLLKLQSVSLRQNPYTGSFERSYKNPALSPRTDQNPRYNRGFFVFRSAVRSLNGS